MFSFFGIITKKPEKRACVTTKSENECTLDFNDDTDKFDYEFLKEDILDFFPHI